MDYDDNHLAAAPRAATYVLRGLIALLLVLFTLAQVLALSVQAPISVHEGNTIDVSVTGPGTLAILLNGIELISGTGSIAHQLTTNTSSAGLYQYSFTTTEPGEQNESRTVEVLDVPLEITVTAPTGSEVATNDVTFALTTNLAPELCYVTIDGSSHSLTAQTSTSFSETLNTADGVHDIDYKCKLDSELPTVSKTLMVDTTPPVITSSSPNGEQTGPYVTLTVDTDEIAQCAYGTQDASYDQLLLSMGMTYALRNTATLNLQEHGPQTYFVRCRDIHGNAMQTSGVISFLNRLAPTAEIRIDGDEPLAAGTYEVQLDTNVDLSRTPGLSYTLQDSGAVQTVVLTGEDDMWEGFITIPEDSEDTVLSFTFEGRSHQGVTGTEIESGAVFTVDAEPPNAIDAITVHNDSGVIELTWFVKKPEEEQTYNIYRSNEEGVTYADYYATTRFQEFTDASATGARYYYYRVASVDEADNIGPLSEEVWGTVIDNALEETVSDPLLAARMENVLLDLTTAVLDANETIKVLEEEPNPTKIRIIDAMSLIEDARSVKLLLEQESTRLAGLKNGHAEAITHAQDLIVSTRKQLVTKIYPEGQVEYNQPSDPDGLQRHLPYALVGKEIPEKERENYANMAIAIQDRMTVSLTAMSFTLWNRAGEQKPYTFIQKRIQLDQPENDVKIIEVIPKDVAEHVSAVIFNKDPVVLEEDPVVQYTFPVLEEEEYSYVLERIIPLDQVRHTRTYAYPREIIRQSQENTNAITGQVTKESLIPSFDTVLIALAVLVVIGLSIYYVSISADKTPFKGLPRDFTGGTGTQKKVRPARRIVARRRVQQPKDIPQLLDDAEHHIDAKEYEPALHAYKEVIRALSKDEGIQAALDEQTVCVYKKLLLFKRLDDTRVALEQKNSLIVRKQLEQAQLLANELGDQETRLITGAKEAFARFVRELNTLEIERTADY